MKKIIIILFMTCISMLLAADEGFFTSYSEMIAGDFVFHEDGNGQFVNNEGVVQDFLFSWSIDDGLIFFQIEKPWFEDIYRKQVKKILLLAGREYSGRNFAFGFYNELNAQKWPSMLFSDVPREFEGSGRIYKDPSSHLVEGTKEYSVDNLDNPYPGTPWVEAAQGHGIGEGFTIENSWGTVYTRLLIMNGYISFDKPYLYAQNSRVKKLKVTGVKSGRSEILEVLDTPHPQTVDISFITEAEDIRVEIADVYSGTKYQDTCLNFCITWNSTIEPVLDCYNQ